MAQKVIELEHIGQVVLQKRKGSRSIRLSIDPAGMVKVSMPTWTPYHVGEAFVRSKAEWIAKHQVNKHSHVFEASDRIGKAHRLQFIHEERDKPSGRVTKNAVIVRLPAGTETASAAAQSAVQKAALRALKHEAKQLLPSRVQQLAAQHGFTYKSVSIKQLKSRWGSCSSQQEIALNCFLMQLPWDLIDYVILHELMHTQIMAHGPSFWNKLGTYVNDLPTKRKTIREYQPMLKPQG